MLECWFVGNGSDDEPVKHPIPKKASIELVAEFIEVFLKKLILYAMIHISEQAFCICYSGMHPWQSLWRILGLHHFRIYCRHHLRIMGTVLMII